MIKKIISTCVAFVALNSTASFATEDSQWLLIDGNDNYIWEAKKGTGVRGYVDKAKAAMFVMQVKSLKQNKVNYYKMYVSDADCIKGYGTLIYNTLENKYSHSHDFVFGGGNVDSVIAAMGCGILAEHGVNVRNENYSWSIIASSKDLNVEYYSADSGVKTKNNNNGTVGTFLIKVLNKKENRVTFEEVHINENSCKNYVGKIRYFDLKGKKVNEGDYVNAGASINSAIGDRLCSLIENKK